MTPTPGKVYMIRGGHILRHVEAWRFRCPQGAPTESQFDTFLSEHDVLRELTLEGRPLLERRRDEARARGLEHDARDAEFVLRELEGAVP